MHAAGKEDERRGRGGMKGVGVATRRCGNWSQNWWCQVVCAVRVKIAGVQRRGKAPAWKTWRVCSGRCSAAGLPLFTRS